MWVACGILVPQLGIKPVPLAVEAQILNHWTRSAALLICLLWGPYNQELHEVCGGPGFPDILSSDDSIPPWEALTPGRGWGPNIKEQRFLCAMPAGSFPMSVNQA